MCKQFRCSSVIRDSQSWKEIENRIVRSGFFWFTLLLLVAAIGIKISETVTVSSNVDGRELPIYCVETEEKVVGLSFDAAWGNT